MRDVSHDEQMALKWALNYVAARSRTSKQLSDALKKKGFSTEITESIVQRFQSKKWIDDHQYAQQFIRDSIQLKKKGEHWIRRALLEKGIESSTIQELLLEVDDQAQFQTAHQLAQKKWATLKQHDYTGQRKLSQMLMRRGYDFDLIQRVLADFDFS